MNSTSAVVLLKAARRSGDHLMSALTQIKDEVSSDDFERWKQAVGRAMTCLYEELVDPICESHPEIVPKSLGGNAED